MSERVSDAIELLQHVELDGIEFYELRGQSMRREVEEFEDEWGIRAAVRLDEGTLHSRFSLTFSASTAEYFVDLAVRYTFAADIEVPEEVAREFVEKVGIMAAFPYLRENVHGIASRMSHPAPVLGLIKQGQFTLTPDEAAPTRPADE